MKVLTIIHTMKLLKKEVNNLVCKKNVSQIKGNAFLQQKTTFYFHQPLPTLHIKNMAEASGCNSLKGHDPDWVWRIGGLTLPHVRIYRTEANSSALAQCLCWQEDSCLVCGDGWWVVMYPGYMLIHLTQWLAEKGVEKGPGREHQRGLVEHQSGSSRRSRRWIILFF